MDSAPHPYIGRELGNYVVLSLLGEGGMGAVFRGEHRFLKTPVAIKLLHGTYASNPAITQRFFQEAKSSIEIGHPNIIKILDFGQSNDGALYLVMELLEGESLSAARKRLGRLPENEALRVCAAIADGLNAAHQKGIIHRDLKPDNVFLTAAGEVKILDFGIAKVTTSGAGTATGALMGTPTFMAPEQCRDSKMVGPQTDVYALGAILFDLLCGQPPFSGEFAELLAQHLFEKPRAPSSLAPVSPAVEALVLRCLEKAPEARPPGMAAVRDELIALAGGSAVRPSQSWATVAPGVASSTSSPSYSSRPGSMASVPPSTTTLSGAAQPIASMPGTPARPSSSRGLLVAGVVVLLLGVGAGVFMKMRGGDEAKPAAVVPSPPAPSVAAAAAPPAAPAEPAPAVPKPATERVVLRTDPPGAKVTVAGKPAGETPLVLNVELPAEVTMALDGYEPLKEVVNASGDVAFRLKPVAAPVAFAKSSSSSSSSSSSKKSRDHKSSSSSAPAARPAAPSAPTDREGLY
jgi:serine/threonine-protein kinase